LQPTSIESTSCRSFSACPSSKLCISRALCIGGQPLHPDGLAGPHSELKKAVLGTFRTGCPFSGTGLATQSPPTCKEREHQERS
jgi:hypothetical protein